MRLTISFLFAILVIGLSSLSVGAQGICVQEPLVVSRVAGRVVAQLDKGETPLHDVTVKILNRSQRVIAKAVTRDDGLFDFTRTIKPGRYVLDVSYTRLLATYTGDQRSARGTKRAAQRNCRHPRGGLCSSVRRHAC